MAWQYMVAILALLGAAHGCADGTRASSTRSSADLDPTQREPRAGDDGTVVFNNAVTGTQCDAANLTRACQCDDNPGRQVCGQNRVWGSCECLDPEIVGSAGTGALSTGSGPPANKAAASFDWLRTAPQTGGASGECVPGRYAGALDGLYNAPSAFNAPVPIVSVDVTGAPGLQIDLAKGGNGEFLTVTGGYFSGVALAIFPFEADFADGTLDCATGEVRARIVNGTYVVFFDGFYGGSVVYQFEGEMVARYDAQTRTFRYGRWAVSEGSIMPPTISPAQPPPVFPIGHAGGTGTWTATWVP